MAAFDFKTATPESAISDSNLLFGAPGFASTDPAVYPVSTLRTLLLGGGNLAITAGKTLTVTETLTLTASAAGQTYTFPAAGGTVAMLNSANLFTTSNTIVPSTDVVSLTLQRPTGATLDILQLKDSSANNLAAFDVSGFLTLGRGSGITGKLTFANATNNNTVSFQAGVSTASVNYTLPLAAPALNGYVLSSTTAGVLSWIDPVTTIGTSTISGGVSGRLLYDNAGVFGETSGITTNGTNLTLSSSSTLFWSSDLALGREAANTLAQRNGASAQGFNLYNTYTDASNYERLSVGFVEAAATLSILSQAAGTGAARPINLSVTGGGSVTFGASGRIDFYRQGTGTRWSIDTSGNFIAGTDNVYDIGASLATRPRTVYVGTSLSVAGASLGGNAFAVTGSAVVSSTLSVNGATIGTNALAVTGSTSISSTLTVGGDIVPAAGGTTMTVGFTYIPAAAGAPTGIPAGQSGRVPLYYDTTGDFLYVYNGSWKRVSFADNFLTQE